jgi:hypothetical protein
LTDGWDERTEAIPGSKDDKSFELDVDFSQGADRDDQPTSLLVRPSIVVFEPVSLGLATALEHMGFAVRTGATGVDVMALVSTTPPAAVLCAPSPDSERRRLLAAALRLRFPSIPVVYVSTHAGQEEAVLGAIREGARGVIAWPLPPAADVRRVLAPYVEAPPAAAGDDDEDLLVTPKVPIRRPPELVLPAPLAVDRPSTGRVPLRAPASSEEQFEEAPTLVTDEPLRPAPVETGTRAPAPRLVSSTGEGEPATSPGLRPAPIAALEALREKRGEIGSLLAAVSPFLWSLEDAARWADALAEAGDPSAKNHARTLKLLAKILGQLQARIDEAGL